MSFEIRTPVHRWEPNMTPEEEAAWVRMAEQGQLAEALRLPLPEWRAQLRAMMLCLALQLADQDEASTVVRP